jgi:pyruvate formate lyase activating enzyme
MTEDQVIEELSKDSIYYDASQGGVTFSGGEPLMQPTYLNHLLKRCKENGFHTAVDTSGYAPPDVVKSILKTTDLFLYDMKILNDRQHQNYTGGSNTVIKKNLQIVDTSSKEVILRISIVPGITDTQENINALINFIVPLKKIQKIDLLAYHNVQEKYIRLGKTYQLEALDCPTRKKMQEIQKTFEDNGFTVKIGG